MKQVKGRTIVIGDIHNAAEALKQLFKRIKPTKDDTFIFIGDYVDGWPYPVETLKFLLELDKKYYCIFLEGNHDAWLKEWLFSGKVLSNWTKNGGKTTYPRLLEEFKTDPQFREDLLKWSRTWRYYYLDDENRLFVHGGIVTKDVKDSDPYNIMWDRSLWLVTLTCTVRKRITYQLKQHILDNYKEIYLGHTSCYAHSSTPMRVENIINMDTGAGWHGLLSAMDIDTKEIWQSDIVKRIYPDEFFARETLNQ